MERKIDWWLVSAVQMKIGKMVGQTCSGHDVNTVLSMYMLSVDDYPEMFDQYEGTLYDWLRGNQSIRNLRNLDLEQYNMDLATKRKALVPIDGD